jgi:hypothetical protein
MNEPKKYPRILEIASKADLDEQFTNIIESIESGSWGSICIEDKNGDIACLTNCGYKKSRILSYINACYKLSKGELKYIDEAFRVIRLHAKQLISEDLIKFLITEYDDNDPDFRTGYDMFIEEARNLMNKIREECES